MKGAASELCMKAAASAANILRWNIVYKDDFLLIVYTDIQDYLGRYKLTFSHTPNNIFISAESLGYDNDIDVNGQKYIEIFYNTMEAALVHIELADRNLHPMHREKYGALLISKTYKATPVIVYINALVYLAMIVSGVHPLSPSAKELYEWGGNFGPAVSNGEWWRFVTYMFLHGGVLHLIMNTFALLYVGMHLEPLLGKFRFGAAYLLTGICAALLSISMHGNTVSVGASGAIFGMFGVFLSILTTNHIQRTVRKTMLRSMLFFVVFNLMMGLQGNTDNAAHIGGLMSGFIIGFVYFPGIIRKTSLTRQVIVTALILLAVFGISMLVAYYAMNN